MALDEAIAEFRHLDDVFSPFKPESAVSRINRGELAPEDAGELVRQAIGLCEMYAAATDGYFSAWIGGRIDPCGLVKAWAIDRACSLFATLTPLGGWSA
jgi:thiamine biosynthesis lipoprotein